MTWWLGGNVPMVFSGVSAGGLKLEGWLALVLSLEENC